MSTADRIAVEQLAASFDDDERERMAALEAAADPAYVNAPTYKLRVDGEDSSLIAIRNASLGDDTLANIEADYRRRCRRA